MMQIQYDARLKGGIRDCTVGDLTDNNDVSADEKPTTDQSEVIIIILQPDDTSPTVQDITPDGEKR